MAICANCKQSGEYYEQDGLYYCNRCDTQSQTMQVMDAEEMMVTNKVSGMHSHKIKKKEVRKTGKTAPNKMQFRKKTVIPGAWKYQTMQLILQAQVNTLVDMGVAPSIKDVVRQLWFLYLHKLNIAFCNELRPPDKKREGKGRLSEVEEAKEVHKQVSEEGEDAEISKEATDESEPGSPSLLSNKTYMQTKTSERTAKKKTKERTDDAHSIQTEVHSTSDKDEATEIQSSLSTDDKYTDSESNAKDTSGDKTTGTISDIETNALTGEKQIRKKYTEKLIAPSVHNLLCLVYIGLRYIGEPVLLCDVIRLVHDNNLPFGYADHLIPQDLMKWNQNEFKNLFCRNHKKKCQLTHQELIRRIQSLHILMDIPIFPSPNMAVVIARFVALLNLPTEVNQFTYMLYSNYNPRFDKKVFPHDVIAMAFIIVTLRLLFILDDKIEHKLSVRAQRLRSVMPAEVPVFVWDEWVCAIKLHRDKRIIDGATTDVSDMHQVRNVDKYLRNILKCSRVEDYKDLKVKTKSDGWEWREERQKCFRLVENSVTPENPVKLQTRVSSKRKRKRSASYGNKHTPPKKKQKKQTINVRKQIISSMEHSEIIWESKDDLLKRDFTDYSMQYLLDFDKFCTKYGLGDKQHWLLTGERDASLYEDIFDERIQEGKDSKLTGVAKDNVRSNSKSKNKKGMKTKKVPKSEEKKISSNTKKVGRDAISKSKPKIKKKSKKHPKKRNSKDLDGSSESGPKSKKRKKKKAKDKDGEPKAKKTKDTSISDTTHSSDESKSKMKKKKKSKGTEDEPDSKTKVAKDTSSNDTSHSSYGSKSKKKKSKGTEDKPNLAATETKDMSTTDTSHSSDGSKSKKKKKKKSKRTEDKPNIEATETKDMSTTETSHINDGSKSKKKKKSKGTDDKPNIETTEKNDMTTTATNNSSDGSKSKKKKKIKSKETEDKPNIEATEKNYMSTTETSHSSDGSKSKKKKKKSKGTDDKPNIEVTEKNDMSTTETSHSSDGSKSKKKKKTKSKETKDKPNIEVTKKNDMSTTETSHSSDGSKSKKKKKSKGTDDKPYIEATEKNDMSTTDTSHSSDGSKSKKKKKTKSKETEDKPNIEATEKNDMSTTETSHSSGGSKSKKKKSRGTDDKPNIEATEKNDMSTTETSHSSDGSKSKKKKKKSRGTDDKPNIEATEKNDMSTTETSHSSDGSKSKKKKKKKSKRTKDKPNINAPETKDPSSAEISYGRSKFEKKKKQKKPYELKLKKSKADKIATSSNIRDANFSDTGSPKKLKKKVKKVHMDSGVAKLKLLKSGKKKRKKHKEKRTECNFESKKKMKKKAKKRHKKSSHSSIELRPISDEESKSKLKKKLKGSGTTHAISPFDRDKIDQIIAAKMVSRDNVSEFDSFDSDAIDQLDETQNPYVTKSSYSETRQQTTSESDLSGDGDDSIVAAVDKLDLDSIITRTLGKQRDVLSKAYPEQGITNGDGSNEDSKVSDTETSSDVSLYMIASSKKKKAAKRKKEMRSKHSDTETSSDVSLYMIASSKKKKAAKSKKEMRAKTSKRKKTEATDKTDTDKKRTIKLGEKSKKSKHGKTELLKYMSHKSQKKRARSSDSDLTLFSDAQTLTSTTIDLETSTSSEQTRKKQVGLASHNNTDSSVKHLKRKKKKCVKKGKCSKNQRSEVSSDDEISTATNSSESEDDSISERRPLNIESMKYPLLKDNMNIDDDKLPRSLVWLIRHCAWLIQVDPQHLLPILCEVEVLVMNPSDLELKMKRMSIISRWSCQE